MVIYFKLAFEKSEQNFVPHGGKAPVNPPFPPLFPKVDFQKGESGVSHHNYPCIRIPSHDLSLAPLPLA